MNTEAVVYIARKLGWSRKEIGELTPNQFKELLAELHYQESIDEYRRDYAVASILAAVYNTIPRKAGHKALTPRDFLAWDAPTRDGKRQETSIEILAKEKGIILPKGE